MEKSLKRMHPMGLLLYFSGNFLFAMWSRHPWMTGIQMVCLCSIYFYHEKSVRKLLPFFGIVFLAAVTNPLFVQRGITVLFYIGNLPVTMESFFYGLHYGCILMNTLLLFSIFRRYFRQEHWVYLFGSIFPKLGVMFSMAMGLLPKYKKQTQLMLDTQKQFIEKSLFHRVMKVCSMETTWAFETSMDQLDSMNARGYGLKKRTHFHLFQFEKKDAVDIIEILMLCMVNGYGYLKFYSDFYFYPMIVWNTFRIRDVFFVIFMAAQILLPFLWKEGSHVSD